MNEEEGCSSTSDKHHDEENRTKMNEYVNGTSSLPDNRDQGNYSYSCVVAESEPSRSECDEDMNGHSEDLCLEDGDIPVDIADCSTRENSQEAGDVSHPVRDGVGRSWREQEMECEDLCPLAMCQRELHQPDMIMSVFIHITDNPKHRSVQTQVSLESSDFQDFNFTCDWERTGRVTGNRNAIVQCNLAKGWCIGVPNLNFISGLVIKPKRFLKSASTSSHRKPVPVIVKHKNKSKKIKVSHNITSSRSIGSQSCILPKRGYTVSSKGIQVCLPISSFYDLSFLKKIDSTLSKKPQIRLSDSITITKATANDDREVTESLIPEPEASVSTVNHTCAGFRGFESIEGSDQQDADFRRLCGFGIDIFRTLLSKLDISGNISPLMSNKSVLLLLLMELNLGIPSSALGVLFGLDAAIALDLVITTLRTLRSRIRNVLYIPSRDTVSNELPPYFQGVYKKARVILLFIEFVTEEPTTEVDRVRMYSGVKGSYTFKSIIAVTPLGKVCFKSKPYRGQTSFGTILKECNLVGHLETGDVVLAESLLPEMHVILQKGVLVVVPSCSPVREDDGSRTRKNQRQIEEDYAAEVRNHVGRCARRLTSVKLLREIPNSLFPYITELLHVWYYIVNQMLPIYRHDQPEE